MFYFISHVGIIIYVISTLYITGRIYKFSQVTQWNSVDKSLKVETETGSYHVLVRPESDTSSSAGGEHYLRPSNDIHWKQINYQHKHHIYHVK